MKNKILYISFYDLSNQKFKRVSSLAAISQVDYVNEILLESGYEVDIISPSWFDDSTSDAPYTTQQKLKIKENLNIIYSPTFGTKNKYIGYFKILYSLLWLFFYLLKNTKKNQKIIMYHSPWLALPVLLAKKIKNFTLVLEVGEIYADVTSLHHCFDKLEQKIINNANAYLFSTESLANKIVTNQPFAVFYGNYKVFPKIASPINDGKIHLIYAGIIDSEKLGAFNAIETAIFLDENYILHILGTGDTDKLINRINEINLVSKCKIIFDGQKSGNDYVAYCQSCHIGLSTQKMEGGFVDSSFPSKILSYLGMGLQVVSGYVSVVANSKIANNVSFYKIDHPQNIAETIKNIRFTESASIKMNQLNIDFKNELLKILN